jgi:hypothetical protein
MTGFSERSDSDIFVEKNGVENIVDSPPSEVEGIVRDWDGEEAAVKRK